MALTIEEASELKFRDTVLGPALSSNQVRAYESEHSATFAGDYLDNAAGGIATFLFTQSDPQYLAKLSALIPYPSRVTVRMVHHTQAELDGVKGHITEAARGSLKINSVGVDVPTNVVQVNVPACDGATLAALGAFPPDELYVFEGTQSTVSTGTN